MLALKGFSTNVTHYWSLIRVSNFMHPESACLVGSAQQWRRGRVLAKDGDIVVLLGGCWPAMEA